MKFTLLVALATLAGTSLALPHEPFADGQCTGSITKTPQGYKICGAAAGGLTFTGVNPGKADGCVLLPLTQ